MASEEDDYSLDSGSDEAEEAADYFASPHREKVNYRILNEEDIKHLQENDISAVSSLLSVPRGVACSLLCRNKWCLASVYDQWFAAAADGDRNPDPAVKPPQGSIEHLCNFCYKKTLPEKLVSAACAHLFCTDCWKVYIATAVSGGAACLTLLCPDPGCSAAVTFEMVEKLASEGDIYRYHEYLHRSYVESSRNIKWCPGAGCDRAVEFNLEVESERYDVVCDCSHKFCWRCGVEWHSPVDCKAAAEWVERNRSEAESTMWILDNTKPCPKCGRPVQEWYTGYFFNYTKCAAPCSYEFCWKCSAPWRGKVGDVGCFRGCKKNVEEEPRRNKAKRFSERYIHCYERWDANDKLRKRAMDDLERVRKSSVEIGKMQFVVEAWEQIVEFLRVLKWSYVYGYSLSEEGGKATFLEHLQANAEEALERLHHCVEKEIRCDECFYDDDCEDFREFRRKLLCLISVTGKYFENLVMALENDLAEVENNLVTAKVEMALENDHLAREVESSAPNSEKERTNDIFFSTKPHKIENPPSVCAEESMSSTLLEVTRASHEEVERFERLVVKDLQTEPPTNKDRLYQSHRVRNMIDQITDTTHTLVEIYEDNDNARKDEIAALGGQSSTSANLNVFYDRLKEVREYHRRHPASRTTTKSSSSDMIFEELRHL